MQSSPVRSNKLSTYSGFPTPIFTSYFIIDQLFLFTCICKLEAVHWTAEVKKRIIIPNLVTAALKLKNNHADWVLKRWID